MVLIILIISKVVFNITTVIYRIYYHLKDIYTHYAPLIEVGASTAGWSAIL